MTARTSFVTFLEGVALILSGTIGAGIFGIPYAIQKVGLSLGLVALFTIGIVTIGINLLVARISSHLPERKQLVGLSEIYLGPVGKWLMMVVSYTLLVGVLLAYMVGEGQALSALFGGSTTVWSILFFIVASLCVSFGIQTVKIIELVLMSVVLSVVLLIVATSAPSIDFSHWQTTDWSQWYVPYGVLFFAYHGAAAIPQTTALLGPSHLLRRAIVVAGIVVMCVYVVFTVVVIGVTGEATTEVATVGLGRLLGNPVAFLGNLFAVFAMGTSFLLAGLAFVNSLEWDVHVRRPYALTLALTVPLIVFVFGFRSFILLLDILGGVFISIEIILIFAMAFAERRRKLSTTHS